MYKKLKSGSHSVIKLVSLLKNDTYVEKIYGKKTVIAQKHIALLFEYFLKYRKIAETLDLPICATSYDKIIQGSKNSYIVELQSYVETNFEDFIRTETRLQVLVLYIEKYLQIFKKIWDADFPIGVDPLLRNYGIDNDGELKYFDFFPSHQKITGGSYFFWPDPSVEDKKFFIERTFTTKQVRVIYFQLMRHLVIHRVISPQELKRIISSILGSSILKHLQISMKSRDDALSRASLQDIDIIRIVACDLCFERKISQNQLTMIFKYTHIDNQNILISPKKIKVVAKLLTKALRLYEKK